jgi:hypothetical protein
MRVVHDGMAAHFSLPVLAGVFCWLMQILSSTAEVKNFAGELPATTRAHKNYD